MAKDAITPKVKLGLKLTEKIVPVVAVNCTLNKKDPLREYLRRAKPAGS